MIPEGQSLPSRSSFFFKIRGGAGHAVTGKFPSSAAGKITRFLLST